MAEKQKSETIQKIRDLTNDCEKLEDLVDQLNQDAVDVVKHDKDERDKMNEEHNNTKTEFSQAIFELKD